MMVEIEVLRKKLIPIRLIGKEEKKEKVGVRTEKVVSLNRRKAVRERCIDCSGGDLSEVRNCKHTECPLHPFRMGRGKQDPEKRKRAIRDFCLWSTDGQQCEVAKCPTKKCPLFAFRLARVDRSVEIKN